MVPGWFFIVPGEFLWLFMVPGHFFWFQVHFYGFSRFQFVFFCGFMSVLIVFQGFRLAFHGSRWVFIDPGRCSMVLGGFFMAPGVFHGFSGFQVGFS